MCPQSIPPTAVVCDNYEAMSGAAGITGITGFFFLNHTMKDLKRNNRKTRSSSIHSVRAGPPPRGEHQCLSS